MENPSRFKLLPSGFHGDRHLQAVAHTLLEQALVFIETGTNVGSTLLHVASKHPAIHCLSCEPDPEAFSQARANTSACSNVQIFPADSQRFFSDYLTLQTALLRKNTMFWLDAHCYGFKWPLPKEITFISQHFDSAWILVDDCAVPGRPEFGFHSAAKESCTIPTIRTAILPGIDCRIWHPIYTERTSPWHPLTGWCLIAVGHAVQAADRVLGTLPNGIIRELVNP